MELGKFERESGKDESFYKSNAHLNVLINQNILIYS
jgi:hypothetical protein